MKNKPRIRFKGFAEDWEQCKLGEIFEYLQNNTLSRDSLNYKNPNIKNIHYGDILVKFDEILDGSNKDIPYINSELDLSKFSKSLLQDGDIIFSDTAEDDTVGKAIELKNVNAPFILSGLHTIPCRPLIPFGKGYLGNFLNSDSYRVQLRPLVQGIKVSSISKSALKDTMIEYPKNLDEQEKIGSLFQNVAKMITLHQRKLEKLKLAKKALLQKLFPKNGSKFPELRFNGFADAWEQRELSSLTEYIGTGKSRFAIKEFGEYAILGSTNVIGYDDAYDYDGNFILTARVGANAGQLYQYSGKVKITDNTVFLMSDRSQFIYYALTHFDLRRLSFGTGQPLVKSSELQKLKLCVPVSKSEQEKIGEIFNNIDNIITLHQRKLDKLQEVKKGLLQKMFV